MATPSIRGIDFVLDNTGRRKAVLIDLKRHGEVWRDLFDRLLAQQRQGEPRESLAEVRRKLKSVRRTRRA
jgi:hypothetical protein